MATLTREAWLDHAVSALAGPDPCPIALEAHERLGAVLRAAAEYSIIGTDLSGRIVVFNEGAERMLGYRAEEMLGLATPVLIHDPDELAAFAAEREMSPGFAVLVQTASQGEAETREWTYVRKDGSRLPVSLTVTAMRGLNGEVTGYIGIARDLSERRRTEAELERLRRRHRLILNSAGEGICGLDLGGRTIFANPAAARMAGYTPQELIGRHLHDTIHYARADGTPCSWDECPTREALLDGRPHRATDEVFWRKDGTPLPVEYVSAPIREGDQIVGAVVVFQDVSERRRAEAERDELRAREEAAREAAERLKDEFIANVSHDLRTPVTAIKASVGVVLENLPPDMPEALRRLLVNVDLAADRMTRLVTDLLELTRLQAGRVQPHLDRWDLREPALRSAHEVESLAEARGQHMVMDLPAQPVWALVDVERIERALLNLLSNAQKYGRAGGTIRLSLERRGSEAVFAVTDDGPGIPEAEQQRIFQRFYRQSDEHTRGAQGSGLGLAIAQGMVRLHGGRIWVESAPGCGSTFRFTLPTLPLAEGPSTHETPRRRRRSPDSGRPRRGLPAPLAGC